MSFIHIYKNDVFIVIYKSHPYQDNVCVCDKVVFLLKCLLKVPTHNSLKPKTTKNI